MAGRTRTIESTKERVRREAHEERQRKKIAKKRQIRYKSPKRSKKERIAKAEKMKELGQDARELIDSGLCPICCAPYSLIVWHHVLSRSLFPELIFDPEGSFMGCDSRQCGHSLDRDHLTGQPLTLKARIERIAILLGEEKAEWARTKCKGRLLDK